MLVGLTAAELRLGLVQFDWTFVFQIANTLILFLFLKKFLFKPVTEFMTAREEELSGAFKDAEDKNNEADVIKSEYLEKISKAEDEGRTIVKEASKRAEKRASDIIKDAEHEVSSLRDKAKVDIEREKSKAINALKDDIAGLAILAATKVVKHELKEEEHKDLINQFIDEVGDAKWQN